ncbi:MAG: hypothetical protein RIG82_13095 [Phycisphaeraceae bacterium]
MSQGEAGAMLPVPARPAMREHVEAEHQQVSPLRRVHHLLQGRYVWAITLASVFGVIGGVTGYFSLEDKFLAQALIEAQSDIPVVVQQLEEHQPISRFEQWVAQRAEIISTERVLTKAVSDEAVQRFVLTDEDIEGRRATLVLRQHLRVMHDRRTNMISIGYEDSDPEVAEIAAQAITEAFMEIDGQRDIDRTNSTISRVEEIRANLLQQIARKKQEISLIANEFGSDALMSMYEGRLEELQKFESRMRETEAAMTMRGIDPTMTMAEQLEAIGTGEAEQRELTAEMLAARDPYMRNLMNRRDELNAVVKMRSAQFGVNNLSTRSARLQYETNEEEIESYLERARARQGQVGELPQVVVSRGGDLNSMTEFELIRIYASQKQVRDRLNSETLELGQKRLRIDELKSDVEMLEVQLGKAEDRLQRLQTEAGRGDMAGRLQIASNAFAMPEPINGGSRKQLAVAGFGAGAMLGFGIVLGIGLMDPRVRSSDEATSRLGAARLLGVLPLLPEDLGDPANAAMVGYSVHHMRTLLQLGHRATTTPAFAVTGPASGSGKTSLTIALGMSFAATGAKTLLIDSDLAGGGLSYRLEAVVRRQIGRILVDAGEITSHELQQALAAASSTGQRLGESLINLGLLEPSRLSEILELQTSTHVGLLDAINGDPVQACITATDIPNLWVLPIGGALLDDMGRISPAAVRRVIEEARGHFDAVLIDTGPVPGSVETSMVAAEADQVVMIVARGDERYRVASAVGFLESLGANLAGFVFNRAEEADLAKSHLSASLSSRSAGFSRDQRTGEAVAPAGHNGTNFGAVARALIASQTYASDDVDRSGQRLRQGGVKKGLGDS